MLAAMRRPFSVTRSEDLAIAGPALIEEHASTTVVFPSDKLEVDQFGNLVIEIGRA